MGGGWRVDRGRMEEGLKETEGRLEGHLEESVGRLALGKYLLGVFK